MNAANGNMDVANTDMDVANAIRQEKSGMPNDLKLSDDSCVARGVRKHDT